MNNLQEDDVYSLKELGKFAILHPESYPCHNKLSKSSWKGIWVWVYSFSGLLEFQEITVTLPTTIDSTEYDNIHILNFKSHR